MSFNVTSTGYLSAGIHLSGPNANKTALAVLAGDPRHSPLKVRKVYEKIGAFGTMFSDERLFGILGHGGPYAQVFIDCPLTVPPCVACQREVCPGAVKCDDVSVAYMLSVSDRIRRRGARKARPVNPQSQRLWDVVQLAGVLPDVHEERLEPSYSANLAPLVTRARTLQRRLNALEPRIQLKETSVTHALAAAAEALGLGAGVRSRYRSFEDGRDVRAEIVDRLIASGALEEPDDEDELAALSATVEVFHALIAAWVAALHGAGLTTVRPAGYVDGEGWIHLPTGDDLETPLFSGG